MKFEFVGKLLNHGVCYKVMFSVNHDWNRKAHLGTRTTMWSGEV